MFERCLIVKPAGVEKSRYGNVGWYDVSFRDLIDTYFNTGDMFVYDSTLQIVDMKEYEVVNIDDPVDESRLDHLRGFDCILLRASNYIHPAMDWTNFAAWLDALQLPVICCGVGAQAPRREKMVLPAEHIRIWKMLAERTASIGVRGSFSAETLKNVGIDNVEVVGCPTVFRGRDPHLKLRRNGPPVAGARVSFSIRRESGPDYVEDERRFLTTQSAMIERLDRVYDLFLTAHGEVEEKIYYYRDPVRLREAARELERSGWFDGPGSRLESLYYRRLFFSTVVAHMDEFNRSMAATIGYRVHGVLPALAVGTPSVLLRYDTRSAELAEALDVPLIDPMDAIAMPLAEIFAAERFDRFEHNFPQHYQRMKSFLEKNNVRPRM